MSSRPVISSDGERYLSAEAAARALGLTGSPVLSAIKATVAGRYETASGFQFALDDRQYVVWPIKSASKLKPELKRFRALLRSDGQEFESVREAEIICLIDKNRLIAAARATGEGIYKKVAGFQWAYADQKPITWPKQESYHGRSPSMVRSDGLRFNSIQEAAASIGWYTTKEIGQAARATSRGEYMEVGSYQWAYSSFVPKVWPKKPGEIGETQ
jgi:hypothetical protein